MRMTALLLLALSSARIPDAWAERNDCTKTVPDPGSSAPHAIQLAQAINDPNAMGDVTVCITGTLSFGPFDWVTIQPSAAVTELAVVGVDDEAGEPATIENGTMPLRFGGLAPGSPPGAPPLPRSSLPVLRILNLRLHHPSVGAIAIQNGNQLVEISGVHVDGVRTELVATPDGPVPFRVGIVVQSQFYPIDGVVDISGNHVNAGSYDPASWDALHNNLGISVTVPFGSADVRIEDNLVENWAVHGIGVGASSGVLVEHNTIAPGSFTIDHPVPVSCIGTGIFISNSVHTLVKNNHIHKELTYAASQPEGVGPPRFCSPAVLVYWSRDNVFMGNVITGTSGYAFVLSLLFDSSAPQLPLTADNLFLGNNTSALELVPTSVVWRGVTRTNGTTVHLGPDAWTNVFVGGTGSVSGNQNGTNRVTGLTPVAGQIGPVVSDHLTDMIQPVFLP